MLSSTPTHDEAQHGYGLAIARELTELLGGTIWCDSTPGAGATFAFRLPLAPDTSEDVPWLTAPPAGQPWTSAVTLPHGPNRLRARPMAVL
jgi:hypothetical protein